MQGLQQWHPLPKMSSRPSEGAGWPRKPCSCSCSRVLYVFTEVKCTQHVLNCFQVYTTVAFSAVTVLCKRHLSLVPEGHLYP